MANVPQEYLPLQRLYRWEQERADRVCMTQPLGGGATRDFTWGETLGEARRMATHLKSFGWPPGTHVAILSKNCAWWLMADYAIWLAGHVSVPVYPTLTAASVRQILEHSDARACFVGKLDDWGKMKAGVPSDLACIRFPLSPDVDCPRWEDVVQKTPPLAGNPVRPADDLATIIYTSGTTGVPKGAMHPFSSFAQAGLIAERTFHTTADERLLSYLPLAHVADRLASEILSIECGCRVFFAESLETFQKDLQRARPTIFMSVPRLWTKFQQGVFAKMPKEKLDRLFRIPIVGRVVKRRILRELGLDHVRYAMSGAAPLPADVLSWFRSLGLEMLEVYGMTENFAVSHCSRPGQVRPGYVGQPWEGVEMRIAESGELLIKSPANMMGYYKDPEKTAEAFTDDRFLRTGDVGETDEMGRLKITGRVKEQFKTSKGKYVAPAPIENLLGTHPKIEASLVTGVAFPQPFAIVMLNADASSSIGSRPDARGEIETSLRAHLDAVNAQLDPHEQLSFVAVVSDEWTEANGFVTPTLKVKRLLVESRYQPYFEGWATAGRPVVWQSA
ncbi:MAG TPA: AMP-binding protein [Candidatus Binatia bacterium]|nr:AMP-binding protein [Candidatus Binatia bacterium]